MVSFRKPEVMVSSSSPPKRRFLYRLSVGFLLFSFFVGSSQFLVLSFLGQHLLPSPSAENQDAPHRSLVSGKKEEQELQKKQKRHSMIGNILYFNSLFRPNGRSFMEEQLQNQEVPHRRIEALSGNVTFCKGKPVCLDRLRVGMTYEWFLKSPSFYLNSDGTALILHRDDVQMNTTHMSLLLESVFGSSDSNSPRHQPDWRLLQIQCDKKQMNSTQATKWEASSGSTVSPASGHTNQANLVPGRCNRTHGILWRNRDDLVSIIGPQIRESTILRRAIKSSPLLDQNRYCLVADSSYCHLISLPPPKETIQSTDNAVTSNNDHLVTAIRRFRNKATLQEIQREVQKRDLSTNTSYYHHADDATINRIFYNNLDKNGLRRQIMENWLYPIQERYNIPYKRISAIRGEPGVCAGSKNTTLRCMGVSGIHRTLVKIIDEEVTTPGLTWVLEDDYVMTDDTIERLQASLDLVPDDWDLIRFDCWGGTRQSGFQKINKYVVQTNHPTKPEPLCGGAYSMLWRNSPSIFKLREMWSQMPYQAVDCVIPRTSSVNSYCINIGLGDEYKIDTEFTDIIKYEAPSDTVNTFSAKKPRPPTRNGLEHGLLYGQPKAT